MSWQYEFNKKEGSLVHLMTKGQPLNNINNNTSVVKERKRPTWLHLIEIFFTKRMLYAAGQSTIAAGVMYYCHARLGFHLLLLAALKMLLLRSFCLLNRRQTLVSRFIKPTIHYPSKYSSFSQNTLPKIIDKNDDKIIINKCTFHTTPRLDIPPYFALLIRPITRVGAYVFGRLLKRWWARKSPQEKEIYKEWLSARRTKIYGLLGCALASLLFYYIYHIETDPITGRSRFIILNKEQQKALSSLAAEAILEDHEDSVLPPSHSSYRRLNKIVKQLLKANQDIPSIAEREWTLTVIDSNETNAFVLPGGQIFVYLGMIRLAENDDQLAFVLAHEIAHVLLLHTIESLSRNFLLDILLAVPVTITWFIIPSDVLAFALQYFGVKLTNILITLPHNRTTEQEADHVGLQIASKACFDVRQAVVFWSMMKQLSHLEIEREKSTWLSTHPAHEDREKYLDTILPEAIDLRNQCGCLRLRLHDPIAAYRAKTAEQHLKQFAKKGYVPSKTK